MTEKPKMHCHDELLNDLRQRGDQLLTWGLMRKWFVEDYSTSKHLLTLYSIARGLDAKVILEIGFGRSSFVLARAAREMGGKFITCDRRRFSELLSKTEKEATEYCLGLSKDLWETGLWLYPDEDKGMDFVFLDYFSNENLPEEFCVQEINNCMKLMKENGVIAIHDTIVEKYSITKVMDNPDPGKFCRKFEKMTLPFNYGLTLIRILDESKYGKIRDQFLKTGE